MEIEEQLPAGSIVEQRIEIVSYLKPDGESQCAVRTEGPEAPVATLLGLLRLAEHSFLMKEPS